MQILIKAWRTTLFSCSIHREQWSTGTPAPKGSGLQGTQIIGENCSRFYTQSDVGRGKPQEELRIAAAHGSAVSERLRVRKDGSQFWAKLVITAARDKSAKLLGFSEINHDITERKTAEANYKARLETALDGMIVANQEGKIVLVKRSGGEAVRICPRGSWDGIETIIPRGVAERLKAGGTQEATVRTRNFTDGDRASRASCRWWWFPDRDHADSA